MKTGSRFGHWVCGLLFLFLLAHPWASSADDPTPTPRRAVPLTWCSLGTSITWYNDHVSSAFTKGYQTRVMERIRFDGFVNRGVNAGRVASAIGQVVPAGLYTIEHGVNDWGHRTPPGTMDDYRNATGTGTFAGGYRQVVDAIRAANPKAVIVLCTPRKGYGFGDYLPARCDAQQPNGYFLKDYADLVRAIAAHENFPLADFFATCGEQDELASLSIDVALHPNDAGYQRMADELVRVLLRRFPDAPVLANDDGELHGDAEMIPPPDDPSLQPGDLVYRQYLRPEPRLVLKGVALASVEPAVGEMAGIWIPGSPYEASVHHIRRSADGSRLVCQFQVRPPDNCLRCVAVEFRQRGDDVTGKILWARYIMNGPEPGVDFDAPGFGGAPIATSAETYGYGIGTVEFRKVDASETPTPETRNPNADARSALLDGVSSVDIPGGIAGPVVCIGPQAFPLALGHLGSGGGEWCAISAAAFAGKGRVVYLGHPAFLDSVAGGEDNRRLLQNAIRWLAEGTDSPKLANLGRPAAGELARSLGYACVDHPASLDGFDIALCNDITDAKIGPLRAFVERGGGLLAAGLGWGWRYYQPEKEMASLAARFPDNQLLAPMGLVMGGGYAHRNPDGRYPAPADLPGGLTADEALDALTAEGYVRLSVRRCAESTLLSLAEALPHGARPDTEARLDALLASPAAQGVPSPATPLRGGLPRIATVARLQRWQADPVRVWPADPAHASYPGKVAPGWTPVTRTVAIDGAVPRWHSTGVFAPAGAPLTVTLPADATGLGLKLRIGTTADNLLPVSGEWRRAPVVSLAIPLDRPETTLSSPFGGLVYIVVPDAGLPGWRGDVTLSGGIDAPWFRLGRDSAADFARQCADTHAPQGEIEGESFVVTCETAQLRRVDDPAWIASFWDRVLEADRMLADLPPRRSPERICSDVQLIAGWLHNGYPLMYHIGSTGKDALDWVVDKAALERGDAWGVFHEIGHNHQSGDWTPDGFGEITVNIFSAYAISEVCGADFRAAGFPVNTAEQAKRIEKFKADGVSYDHLKREVFLALEPYLRIAETYGWDVYRKTFAAYHAPGFAKPKDDAEKWGVFATQLSAAAGADLAAVFAAWGVPVPEAVRADCAARHPAAPDTLLP